MTDYGLTTYLAKTNQRSAIVFDQILYDLIDCYGLIRPEDSQLPDWVGDITTAIAHWDNLNTEIHLFAEQAQQWALQGKLTALSEDVQVLPPFQPGTIFGTASNYHEHAAEMNTILAAKADSSPYVFIKASSSIVGSNAAVILPPETKQLDWEVELGVVIGKQARRVSAANALDYIAGYTVVNDISARDLNRRSDYPFKHDWFRGKSWDTFCPMGPIFVPKGNIADPHNVALKLFLNGKQMQDGNTSELIWNVFEQIEYLSSILTLKPGDLIMTGTPAGVGKGIGLFLKPGDVLEASVEGIGSIKNTVKAEVL